MTKLTHRLFHHDEHGFLAKRELQAGYRFSEDGEAVWSEHDDRLLAEAAVKLDTSGDQLRNGIEFMDVLFIPRNQLAQSGLENLTDDPTVCPAGTCAAFPPIR